VTRPVQTLVLGTAGHIDHGKSALVEALTGTHPDRLKEEQARGITIELGFAHATIGDVSVALVDVPGHERFVRTMLAGAGGLDAVLLIVAANESVMPQTREHFDICRLLGIDRGIVVLTKSDLVDADTLALVELDVRDLVAQTPFARAQVIAVSAHTGAGLPQLRAAIETLASSVAPRARAGVARVPIDRVFSVKGFGTVVTGTLVTGTLAVEDGVVILPGARDARVRGVQVHGQAVESAAAPRRVAVNLGGVDLQDVRRGLTLASPGSLAATRRVDVRVDLLPDASALRHGARVRVHQGTADVSARVSFSAVRSAADAPWVPVLPGAQDVMAPGGAQAFARLRLAAPMVLTRGDRFVLRFPAPARTIGGGIVLDPDPPRGGVRRSGAATRFLRLNEASLDDVVAMWADDAGLAGVTTAEVARRAGVAPADLTRFPGVIVSEAARAKAVADVTSLLTAFHAAHPAEPGMPREEVRTRAAHGASPATFESILAAASVENTERLALRSHRPAVSDEESRASEAVLRVLLAAGLQPPDLIGLAAATGIATPVLTRVLHALGKDKRVVKLSEIWFHAGALGAMKEQVRKMGAGATFDVAAAKTQFGVSRKFAIPLLEFLDRERVTRRVGDRRLVL
jgi:selenocysteine-specific elongation factor